MISDTVVSVVIGFRNWGLERLALSIASINASLGDLSFEVIVSDFGSNDSEKVRSVTETAGAHYLYTASSYWSRAEALNAGASVARGRVVMFTDSDMIFSPKALELVYHAVNPSNAVIVQCRDLPETMDVDGVRERGWDWPHFNSISRLRPRWGMGGLFAVSSETLAKIRGLDERMHTYGGEDLDLAKRAQAIGCRAVWLDHPDVRMYHVWHPPTLATVEEDPSGKTAVEENTRIVEKDPTIVRNLESVAPRFRTSEPLVSVVISTRNRASLIPESIYSVLNQSFRDFELIIVDDGSTDNTRAVVESISDPRIRYRGIEPTGISGARNIGTSMARGKFIAVHDDDDLMVGDRLASSLNAMRSGIGGTYGSWVNFDEESAELALNVSKKDFGSRTIPGYGAAPGHATWLVRRELMELVPYDTSLTSAVDNNVAIRLAALGVRWAHATKVLLMRRLHAGQVTHSDFQNQQFTAESNRNWFMRRGNQDTRNKEKALFKEVPWPKIKEKDSLFESVGMWLPTELVNRRVCVTNGNVKLLESLDCAFSRFGEFSYQSQSGVERLSYFENVSYRDLAQLTTSGTEFSIIGHALRLRDGGNVNPVTANAELLNDAVTKALTKSEKPYCVFLFSQPRRFRRKMTENTFVVSTRFAKPTRIEVIECATRDKAESSLNSALDSQEYAGFIASKAGEFQ